MAKKKPLFGVNNYKKRTPKKRPGRHAKKYSKRKPRRKRSRGQGRGPPTGRRTTGGPTLTTVCHDSTVDA